MDKNIFIVIVEDRHTDTEAFVFENKDVAISEARAAAKEYSNQNEHYVEKDYGRDDGWLFYAEYSSEGDNVRVVASVLNKKVS